MIVERPIIFSGPMVRAILRDVDPKTQTRRVVSWRAAGVPDFAQHVGKSHDGRWEYGDNDGYHKFDGPGPCPYGRPGDRLWVRETHAGDDLCGWVYRADHPNANIRAGELDDGEQSLRRWTPAIHMKRVACRLVLEVTGVRVERVQEISEADAKAEGFQPQPAVSSDADVHRDAAHDWYADLWDSLNAKRGYGWQTNPWVWAVEFRRAAPLAKGEHLSRTALNPTAPWPFPT